MTIKGNILFKETQHFRSGWLWWMVIFMMLSTIAVIVGVAVSVEQKANESWITLAIFIPVEVLVLYFFSITRLETIISTDGIFYKWWPFQSGYSFVATNDVKRAYFRKGPFMSYGYHWYFSYGRVNNMAPGKGIQLILMNGRKIFLGTQRLSAFQTALEKIITVSQKT